jgi:glycerol-3-phosphate O-acyltransferase
MGNHQSEGDAAFIPLLTETTHPGLGESITYVAGDRVVTDLLCKPFSMGKNLLCVHSKKHMDDDPALKPAKMKQNLNTVKAMQRLLKKGGICIWIAPAGGRDRRGPDGSITPDKFDPAAIEMLRKLGTKKGAAKTHYYPLAMATYDIMPPPVAKEKSIGEERIVNFTGAGLSLGEELDVDPATASWAQGLPEGADLTQALADHLWDKVDEEYKAIEACNVPGGGDVPLPEGAIRPVRPPSVPTF